MLSQKLTEEQISPFFDKWAVLRKQLISLHQQRSRQAADTTVEAVNVYEGLLSHCSEFGIIPVNGEDRLVFIKEHAGRYPAFRQLDELFLEVAKKIAAKRVQLSRCSE